MLNGEPELTDFYLHSGTHPVCLEPSLRLFEFGLDPTLTVADKNLLSALQLAHTFIRNHPLPAVAVAASNPLAEMQAVVSRDSESQHAGSILTAYATVHRESWEAAEFQRRNALHARFMHSLVSAWLAHSTKVRCVLLDASPSRLIPPLVAIVSRYLNLGGVPPEPVMAADADADQELWSACTCPSLLSRLTGALRSVASALSGLSIVHSCFLPFRISCFLFAVPGSLVPPLPLRRLLALVPPPLADRSFPSCCAGFAACLARATEKLRLPNALRMWLHRLLNVRPLPQLPVPQSRVHPPSLTHRLIL